MWEWSLIIKHQTMYDCNDPSPTLMTIEINSESLSPLKTAPSFFPAPMHETHTYRQNNSFTVYPIPAACTSSGDISWSAQLWRAVCGGKWPPPRARSSYRPQSTPCTLWRICTSTLSVEKNVKLVLQIGWLIHTAFVYSQVLYCIPWLQLQQNQKGPVLKYLLMCEY